MGWKHSNISMKELKLYKIHQVEIHTSRNATAPARILMSIFLGRKPVAEELPATPEPC